MMECYRYLKILSAALIAGVLCVGCGKVAGGTAVDGNVPGNVDGNGNDGNGNEGDGRMELKLSPGLTKVAGDEFEAGDRIGVFMSYLVSGDGADDNYGDGADGNSSDGASENPNGDNSQETVIYLDNQSFTALNAGGGVLEWKSGDKLWWKDDSTPADFRCYHPYSAQATRKQMLKCGVSADQRTPKALSDSDILWGESLGVAPTSNCVELMTSHRTGQVVVELVPGKGYDKTTLSRDLESLVLKGAVCGAVLNLVTGELVADGEAQDVQPYAEGLVFRALLPPQSIPDFEVSLVVAGLERSLKAPLEIVSNHRRRCTITVNKVTEGVNVGIGGWEDDGEDFGGVLN